MNKSICALNARRAFSYFSVKIPVFLAQINAVHVWIPSLVQTANTGYCHLESASHLIRIAKFFYQMGFVNNVSWGIIFPKIMFANHAKITVPTA